MSITAEVHCPLFVASPVILTLYTHDLRFSLSDIIADDYRSQFSSLYTTCIEAFTVWMQLETLPRVVSIDDRGALLRGAHPLVFIPKL